MIGRVADDWILGQHGALMVTGDPRLVGLLVFSTGLTHEVLIRMFYENHRAGGLAPLARPGPGNEGPAKDAEMKP